MVMLEIVWGICVFVIVYAMAGYPLFLKLLEHFYSKRVQRKDTAYEPSVTVMVVAHNEEKVILEKLDNLIKLDYPADKISFLVTSDCSTDSTNDIVEQFIFEHPGQKIRLHKAIGHKGKTNAQDEAQRLVTSEILVLTDANSMFESDAVKELVSSFAQDDIAYVCGQLKLVNISSGSITQSEGFYWKLDLMCREIESKIQTITAGNGAIYACRNRLYKYIRPIECHDSMWPILYALDQKRAVYNKDAVAYEKAGEVAEAEFKRKVRMCRGLLNGILPDIRILNIAKYRWFSVFYFGHRTCRYLLWLMHVLVFVINIPLLFAASFWWAVFGLQVLFYLLALLGWKSGTNNKVVKIIYYYCMTVAAQWAGVVNILTGKAKPVWEQAESMR